MFYCICWYCSVIYICLITIHVSYMVSYMVWHWKDISYMYVWHRWQIMNNNNKKKISFERRRLFCFGLNVVKVNLAWPAEPTLGPQGIQTMISFVYCSVNDQPLKFVQTNWIQSHLVSIWNIWQNSSSLCIILSSFCFLTTNVLENINAIC